MRETPKQLKIGGKRKLFLVAEDTADFFNAGGFANGFGNMITFQLPLNVPGHGGIGLGVAIGNESSEMCGHKNLSIIDVVSVYQKMGGKKRVKLVFCT